MGRQARQCLRAVLIATVVFRVALPLHYVQASAPESVVINELAWAGTTANANAEWIELYNGSAAGISLASWTLSAADGTPSITLSGTIAAGGYFVLERTADTSIADITAGQVYTGALSNTGEQLTLRNAAGTVMDTANGDGGGWPAGSASGFFSMERINPLAEDADSNWVANNGTTRNGTDSGGNSVNGTPGAANSGLQLPTSTPTATATATQTATQTQTPSATASQTATQTQTPSATSAATATFTPTATPSQTATPTSTSTLTPTATATAVPALSVVINELAWAGTAASLNDEWMELYVPGAASINLAGWTLSDGGDINITLSGTIAAGGFVLLERTDDTSVGNLAAAQIYTGTLNNTGETLTLKDANGNTVDTANLSGGSWPAGSVSSYFTMERINPLAADSAANWVANNGATRSGTDADGAALNGTAGSANSGLALPTSTPTASITPTQTLTPTQSLTPTQTLSPTATMTASATPTLTITPSPTPSATATTAPTATLTATLTPPFAVTVNEVAWAGTSASSSDEWMELYNAGAADIDLAGWTLSDGGDINIALNGKIAPGAFWLLERTNNTTVSDEAADQLYTGGLSNSGEQLTLRDATGAVVDTANAGGGAWPAGSAATHATMERKSGLAPDSAGNWLANASTARNGRDSKGNSLSGTPRRANSAVLPPPATATSPATAEPTASPMPALRAAATGLVLINEVAWMGTLASGSDEWIELFNPGPAPIDLSGWVLAANPKLNIALRGMIAPGAYFLLERTDDRSVADIAADQVYSGALSNAGELLVLRDAAGSVVDTANNGGGAWPAGYAQARFSMERVCSATGPGCWQPVRPCAANGRDAAGTAVRGTPRQPNSWLKACALPAGLHLNEVLVRAGRSWSSFAAADTRPFRYIELYNASDTLLDISYFMLDDAAAAGADPHLLPAGTQLGAHEFYVVPIADSGLRVPAIGGLLRLLLPDGTEQEQLTWEQSSEDESLSRAPDGSGGWQAGWQPSPGLPNRAHSTIAAETQLAHAMPLALPISQARIQPDGTLLAVQGIVSVPPRVFGERVIFVQDVDGAGLAVYLQRGSFPALAPGQRVTMFGYLRTRSAERQLLLAGAGSLQAGETGSAPLALRVRSGTPLAAQQGTLVQVAGTITRVDGTSAYVDDGSGPARIYFYSELPFVTPALQKGDRWLATGVVREYTTAASVAAGVRVSVRFATDLTPQAVVAAAPKAAAALPRGRLNSPVIAPAAARPFWMLPNWDDWLWPGPAPYGVCRKA